MQRVVVVTICVETYYSIIHRNVRNDDCLVCSSYSGYTVFVWVYGSSLGGYNYTLKMSIYHVVRARKLYSNIFHISVNHLNCNFPLSHPDKG